VVEELLAATEIQTSYGTVQTPRIRLNVAKESTTSFGSVELIGRLP